MDKKLLCIDGHEIQSDSRQLIIQHPCSCGFKGSTLDRRKTFHHFESFLRSAEQCGIRLSQDQTDSIKRTYAEIRRTAKY